MTKTILSLIILVGIIMNHIYIRQLEERIDALKSWIELFWRIDFDGIADAVEKQQRRNRNETNRW